MLSKDEFTYLRDLASLDRIHLGMCWPSTAVKQPAVARDGLVGRGLARIRPEPHPAGEIVELTTKGLRTLQRIEAIEART